MKKVKTILYIAGLTVVLTGCSLTIPFQKLLDSKDNITQVEPVGEVPKVTSINLSSPDTEGKNIEGFDKIAKSLEQKLKDKDLYIENITSSSKRTFYSYQNEIFSKEYIEAINNETKKDILIEVLGEIYSTANRRVYSATVVSLGKEVVNHKEVYNLILDVNAVDDDLGFHIQRLNLTLDNNKMIIDAHKIGGLVDEINTTTPITEDTDISASVHKEFVAELKSLITSMSNKALYDKLVQENKNGESSEFKSFISRVNLTNKNLNSLYDMFKSGKGEFKTYVITSYAHKNIDAEPITTYTVTIPYEGGVSSFYIDFNRLNNKIVGVNSKPL